MYLFKLENVFVHISNVFVQVLKMHSSWWRRKGDSVSLTLPPFHTNTVMAQLTYYCFCTHALPLLVTQIMIHDKILLKDATTQIATTDHNLELCCYFGKMGECQRIIATAFFLHDPYHELPN